MEVGLQEEENDEDEVIYGEDGSMKTISKPWSKQTDRHLVDTLLSWSDRLVVSQSHEDSITSWLNDGSNLRYTIPCANNKKKQKSKHNRDRAHNQRYNYSNQNRWPEQYVSGYVPEWKLCVESKSCRYISNNGKYRTSKLAKKLEIHRDVRQFTEKMTCEQKLLQKEIQRDLRREFELLNHKIESEHPKTEAIDDTLTYDRVIEKTGSASTHTTTSSKDIIETPEQTVQIRLKTPIDLPPITVPLVVGRNALQRQTAMDSLTLDFPQDDLKRTLYTRSNDHRPVRSLSEPPNKHDNLISPQTLSYETFSIKSLGKHDKRVSSVFIGQQTKLFKRVTPKEMVISRTVGHSREKKSKYKTILPKEEDDSIINHTKVDDKSFITLENKTKDEFFTKILPEIMGRKIAGCTHDIV